MFAFLGRRGKEVKEEEEFDEGRENLGSVQSKICPKLANITLGNIYASSRLLFLFTVTLFPCCMYTRFFPLLPSFLLVRSYAGGRAPFLRQVTHMYGTTVVPASLRKKGKHQMEIRFIKQINFEPTRVFPEKKS